MLHTSALAGTWWYVSGPLVLSGPPGTLRISIKAVGDFTHGIRDLAAGAFVRLEGPLGAFTACTSIDRKDLMVAGGIGIPPVRRCSNHWLLSSAISARRALGVSRSRIHYERFA